MMIRNFLGCLKNNNRNPNLFLEAACDDRKAFVSTAIERRWLDMVALGGYGVNISAQPLGLIVWQNTGFISQPFGSQKTMAIYQNPVLFFL